MNPNALPVTGATDDIIEDSFTIGQMSSNERKRMIAREYNRAYNAGELNKPVDIRDAVTSTVLRAKQSLGI